jgi:hypothetical protein
MSEETTAPATEAAAPAAAPTTEAAPATEAAPQSTPDIFSGQTQEPSPSGDLMSQLYTSEGNLAENYTSLLEENGLGELTNTVAKYKSPEGLLKGAANLISFAGKKVEGVIVPNEGSTEQEIAEYRQAIGVPESPTAYDLQPENLPENMGWDEGLASEWQNVFHDVGLSQEQAAKIAQSYTDITNNQLTNALQTNQANMESEMEQQRAEIQKQWGDKYDTNLQNAVNMASTMGFDLDNPQDMAAMRNPKVLNMILEKHDSSKEGTMPRGGQPNTGTESWGEKAMAMKMKYPNMNTAPIEVQRSYIEAQKMNHMQKAQQGR